MDKIPEYPILETEELRKDMEERRCSMSRTMGEIRQEMAQALDWETYVRRYPGAVLVGAGILGWMAGRRLRKKHNFSSPSDGFHDISSAPSIKGSTALSRIAEQIVSSVFSQALAIFAVSLKEFLSQGRVMARPIDENQADVQPMQRGLGTKRT